MHDITIDHVGVAMSLINGRTLTDGVLDEVLTVLSRIDPALGDEGQQRIRRRLEATIGVRMSVGEVVRESTFAPWVNDARGEIEWHYWDSYKQLLTSQGRSRELIRVLDEDTDNILTECGNPRTEGAWAVRGLVMGDVQSGKTGSYSGLIAKAADAGYKVIVLLTGMIEDLRQQTQERLDLGFVGRDSRKLLGSSLSEEPIGAGKYRRRRANVLTSVDCDFLTANAKVLQGIPLANINEPLLFVMKKNMTPLKNLSAWLDSQLKQSGHSSHQLPLLIVDDEADNASVNVRKDGEAPAAINRLIREVIEKFARSSYVAYTATPFANVFINPDNETDLFPSNFIYSLNTPSSYIGASAIFDEEGRHYEQVRDIDDAELNFPHSHRKDWEVAALPQSLEYAIRTFLISCVIRDLRDEELRHRSMLVNVSRFTDVQGRVADRIRTYLYGLQEEIQQYLSGRLWQRHVLLTELHETFEAEYAATGVTWEQVRERMHESVASIKVVTVNQRSEPDQKLDYSHYNNTRTGRRVIAVGGLTLSRGLTLEGLCVSYFYRNSKAYDTLLQMGRWFGYRPGYDDLFRIWMDPSAQGWYAHISAAVAELRSDFRRMSANRLPPSRFGIRVRSHPDTLTVTAHNKMRSGKEVAHSVSFSGAGVETPFVPRDPRINGENIDVIKRFVQSLPPAQQNENGKRYFWTVKRDQVAGLLADLNFSNENMHFVPDPSDGIRPLVRFIQSNPVPELETWTVCIPQGSGVSLGDSFLIPTAAGMPGKVQCRERQFEKMHRSLPNLKFNKHRVGEAGDEKIGMTAPEIRAAEANWQEQNGGEQQKQVPGHQYRKFRSSPLLTIHLVQAKDSVTHLERRMRAADVGMIPVVAFSLSFPEFDPMNDEKVMYRLNRVALRDLFGSEDEGDDDTD